MTSTLTTRFAALGAAVALGTTALVAASPAAQAKVLSGNSVYTCDAGSLGQIALDVKTTVKLPAKVKKGTELGAKKVKIVAVLPADVVGGLNFLQIRSLSGKATGAKVKIGKTTVKFADVTFPETDVPASGPMTLKGKGKTVPATVKKAGTFTVKAPKSFKFTAYNSSGDPLIQDARCGFTSGEKKLGSIKVTK